MDHREVLLTCKKFKSFHCFIYTVLLLLLISKRCNQTGFEIECINKQADFFRIQSSYKLMRYVMKNSYGH